MEALPESALEEGQRKIDDAVKQITNTQPKHA